MIKRFAIYLLFIANIIHATPFIPLSDEPVTYPDSYHIIQLEDELFMVHADVDDTGQSDYKILNFQATIARSGLFRLAGDVTSSITIDADNVTLDLEGHFASTITILQHENVTIKNGKIRNANIDATTQGGRDYRIENVSISQSSASPTASSIDMTGISNSIIRNCVFEGDARGVHLTECNNIVIEQCSAMGTRSNGFELTSSTTCLLQDCKAIGVGKKETAQDADVIGFESTSGNANIFERCIANGTQALSVTDFDSIVAGFALRGSESCSKIIECEASNATTAVDGVTIPYGIFLENSIGSQVTLTGTPAIPNPTNRTMVQWRPDGKYLATFTGGSPGVVRVYEWDRLNFRLTQVAISTNSPSGTFPHFMVWSGSGNYILAVDRASPPGGIDRLHVYEFDPISHSLNPIPFDSAFNDTRSATWSRDDQFVVIGSALSPNLRLFEFDRINKTFTLLQSTDGGQGQGVDWSPDGDYLAVAALSGAASTRVRVVPLDRASKMLGLSISPDINPVNVSNKVKWSHDGQYLALAENSTPVALEVFKFTRATSTLSKVASSSFTINGSFAEWSADGKYIMLASFSNNTSISMVKFDLTTPTSGTLTIVATPDSVAAMSGSRQSSLSPDGMFAAWASGNPSESLSLRIFKVFDFPSKNIIKNNTVYCNSGNSAPGGIGISGSSIANTIINNTAYNNPVPQTDIEMGGPVVFTNYAFVTNVFNQLFGHGPSALQNISITDPICTPADIETLAKLIEDKLCDIQTRVDDLLGI